MKTMKKMMKSLLTWHPVSTTKFRTTLVIKKMSAMSPVSVQSPGLPASSFTPSQSSVCGVKEEGPSVQSMFLNPSHISQSVRGVSEDQRRPSVYCLSATSCSSQVRHYADATNYFVCWTSYAARPRRNPWWSPSRRMPYYPDPTRRRKCDTCPYSQPCCPRLAVSSCFVGVQLLSLQLQLQGDVQGGV